MQEKRPKTTRRSTAPISIVGAIFLAVALGLIINRSISQSALPGGIPWQSDFAKAAAMASDSGKPVLLVFAADFCPPCKYMKRYVYPKRRVSNLIEEHFVPVKIDLTAQGEKELAMADRFGAYTIPTIIVLDADGSEILRRGPLDVDELIQTLQSALARIDSQP